MNFCSEYSWRGHKYVDGTCKCGETKSKLSDILDEESISAFHARNIKSMMNKVIYPKPRLSRYITPIFYIVISFALISAVLPKFLNLMFSVNNTTTQIPNILPNWLYFVIPLPILIYIVSKFIVFDDY